MNPNTDSIIEYPVTIWPFYRSVHIIHLISSDLIVVRLVQFSSDDEMGSDEREVNGVNAPLGRYSAVSATQSRTCRQ